MNKNAKVKDIADALGISRNTVSKVLNGRYVPEKTRIAVLRKAEELNYKSMGNASLESNYSILLLSGKPLSNIDYFLPIIRSLENACFQRNYRFFRSTLNKSANLGEQIKNIKESFNPDGIICIEILDSDTANKVIKLGIPTCFLDFPPDNVKAEDNYDIVIPSTYDFGEAIRTTIEKCHLKKATFVGDASHCLTFQQRYVKLQASIVSSGLSQCKECDITDRDGGVYTDIHKLKERIESKALDSRLFVCANDYIARQTVLALKLLKKKVPEEVMVIGYDGSSDALNIKPTITTANVDKEVYGVMVLETLLNRINNKIRKSTLSEFRVNITYGDTLPKL